MSHDAGRPVTSAPIPVESFRSVVIEMYYSPAGGKMDRAAADAASPMATGSAFFFMIEATPFIVTARHNLSGRHWETNTDISSRGVEPTHIRVRFREPTTGSLYNKATLRMNDYLLPLIDGNGDPYWLEHPEYGRRMDVAALPFSDPENDQTEYWRPETAGSGVDSGVWAAQDVFIVGYPFGHRGALDLPLWIRGTIASEPALLHLHNDDPLPMLLVDARTRTGQSGSPVLVLNRHFSDGRVPRLGTPRSKLIGVYSGRINDGADLGFVWRIEQVIEILGGDTRGTYQ
jgi:hypothetical protein